MGAGCRQANRSRLSDAQSNRDEASIPENCLKAAFAPSSQRSIRKNGSSFGMLSSNRRQSSWCYEQLAEALEQHPALRLVGMLQHGPEHLPGDVIHDDEWSSQGRVFHLQHVNLLHPLASTLF